MTAPLVVREKERERESLPAVFALPPSFHTLGYHDERERKNGSHCSRGVRMYSLSIQVLPIWGKEREISIRKVVLTADHRSRQSKRERENSLSPAEHCVCSMYCKEKESFDLFPGCCFACWCNVTLLLRACAVPPP